MIYDLPEEVRKGLETARRKEARRKQRLRVMVGDQAYQIRRLWHDGFSLDSEDQQPIRGLVDIYDGARHLYQCLVMRSAQEGPEWTYTFKRQTAVVEEAPVDFWRDENAPIALLN